MMRRPAPDEKLAAWVGLFHAIADEMLARSKADTLDTVAWAQSVGLGVGPITINQAHVETAAQVAATLLGGTDLGNRAR